MQDDGGLGAQDGRGHVCVWLRVGGWWWWCWWWRGVVIWVEK